MPIKKADLRREKICQEVIRLLQEEREQRALSMSEVAWRAGLSQQMVSYVERGLRMPTLDTLLRMADALEINLRKIIRKAEAAADQISVNETTNDS
ncbi:XRE family transcriptional regulator [Opitutaceae bacterium TAV4]|nr:XRE family transcriptional regulator [Opitutaceae bacterium TAV4]RRK00350.1 XRE family transcriptional regulator [Opitutaceae bacterium TAV3]